MKHTAYDCSKWHSDPACVVSLVPSGVARGVGLWLWCATCRCGCDLEAAGECIEVAESAMTGKARKKAAEVAAR